MFTLSKRLKNNHCEDYKNFNTIEDAELIYNKFLGYGTTGKYAHMLMFCFIVDLKNRKIVKNLINP